MSGTVTVRWGRLDQQEPDRFLSLLSPDELERARSFRFARDRSRYVIARGLLRTILGERLALGPEQVEFAYGEHGKPGLAGETRVTFNLAHSNDLVAIALSDGREIGIDVEARRDDLAIEGIARRYLPASLASEIERRPRDERAQKFLRAWVRQEAYAKARGGGLALIGESPDPLSWSVIDLDSPDGFAGALAIEGGEELIANPASVGHAGGELGKVVDVVPVRTPQPIG
jgi:4'-phosphopantetheinyl transferase